MPNEVKILVRVYNSGKAGLDAVNRDVDDYAKKFSETFTKRFSESMTRNLNQNLTQHIRTVVDQAGRDIGDRMGNTVGERMTQRITERFRTVRDRVTSSFSSRSSSSSSARSGGVDNDRDRVHVSVDVDQKTLMERFGDLGKGLSEKVSGFFQDGIGNGLTSIFSGDVISTALKAGLIGLGVTIIGPALGATISSAILLALGGGAIGAGVYAAIKNNPQIQAGFKSLGRMAMDEFRSFGENFTGPVANFAENLLGVFKQIKPLVDDLGKSLGPVADQLGDGIIGFLQSVLPSIIRGIKASEPLIKVLADNMPLIGDALARFFDHMSQNAPQAATFLNDFLHALEYAIRLLGLFISGLTQIYIFARRVFVGLVDIVLTTAQTILDAADLAFGWIPGFGPKVHHAAQEFSTFADKVRDKLKEVPRSVDVKIRISVVGLATANAAIRTARILKGMMAGGGVAHAAEGGPRSGLTLVGEQGPELVDLAPGSTVHTNGDSGRMLAGAGGVQRLDVTLTAGRAAERGLVAELMRVLRAEIGDHYGGSVQLALGR